MPQINLTLLFLLIGFGSFLWVGLYVVSRTTTQTSLTILSLIAMLTQSTFFLSSILIMFTPGYVGGQFLVRLFWFNNCMPLAFWYHVARRVNTGKINTPSVVVVYTVASIITLLGSFSSLVLDFDGVKIFPGDHWYVGPGPLYGLFTVYVLVVSLAATFNLVQTLMRQYRLNLPDQRIWRSRLWLLLIGSVVFSIGGTELAVRVQFQLDDIPEYFGYIFLIVGIGVFGYAVAVYDMLLDGKNVRRDFAYSFTGILGMNLVYIIMLSLTGAANQYSLLAIIGIVTFTHTLFDWGRGLLDKLFFTNAEREARVNARDYALALGTQPVLSPEFELATTATPATAELPTPTEPAADAALEQPAELPKIVPVENATDNPTDDALPENEKAFNDAVRKSITGIKSPPQLVKSPLLGLKIVEKQLVESGQAGQDNRLNRAAALKTLLTDYIERLRPDDTCESGTTDAWRFYNVLYYPYVREISKKQALNEARRLYEERRRTGQREPGDFENVLNWLADTDEDTYYKWQRKASDTIASILREDEMRLRSRPTVAPTLSPQPTR